MATEAKSDHPNAGAVRKGFQAYSRGDLGTVEEMFADDVVIHVQRDGSMHAGDYQGKDGLRELYQRTAAQMDSDTWDAKQVIADDDYAVAIVEMRGTRKGKTEGTKNVQVFRLKDGKVAEAWYINSDETLDERSFYES